MRAPPEQFFALDENNYLPILLLRLFIIPNAVQGPHVNRIIFAVVAAALVAGAYGLIHLQPVSAQPGGPSVCLSLPPGDHTFTAPSQDREGEVSFTVSVAEGGLVTAFTEPGGQSIPPVAMIEIFTGEDAYPLPDGVTFIECEAAGGDAMGEDKAPELCLNLDPGTYDESVSASGQVFDIVINVGEGNRLISVEVLGESYSPAEALDLLAQFGAAMPPHIEVIPCEPAMTDKGDSGLPYTGSGGLADTGSSAGLWSAIATIGVLVAVLSGAAVRRRRVEEKIRG